ncbi:hypothetical protein [Bifidobacterium cuniculi]|uniref:Sugar ABC transporter periplasmic protein n=1 Tax=Bifidobacterium cuniculi TaxID=1688 RepID=A0A087B3M2_9BIFI|nr:hypothetical protein [Bifidobacterium cuniculi]KFI65622.1 sugar ABC transporter periplasmic protein [Bifidobacterium cuniculi]
MNKRMGIGILFKLVVGILAAMATFAFSSCAPHGDAVGDTQHREPEISYDADPGAPLTVAVIGTPGGNALDAPLLKALQSKRLIPRYTNTSGMADPAAVGQQAVDDAVRQHVKLIMVVGLTLDDADRTGWDDALSFARRAGISVVLTDPVDTPADATLFAAVFTVDNAAEDAEAIGDAAYTVINDYPHARDITVTTRTGEDS